ncbi:MAG: hypothetical protein QHI48_10050 [Bacteroidota bacterium]|nr:hypothetical protein [Bacteroidota bacterium]
MPSRFFVVCTFALVNFFTGGDVDFAACTFAVFLPSGLRFLTSVREAEPPRADDEGLFFAPFAPSVDFRIVDREALLTAALFECRGAFPRPAGAIPFRADAVLGVGRSVFLAGAMASPVGFVFLVCS